MSVGSTILYPVSVLSIVSTMVMRESSHWLGKNIVRSEVLVNPLPHMPILGSSNSAANKDMMS